MARLLIAEDNTLNFELIRDVLEERGHDVEWARDGEEALARARSGGYQLILLDLHMPKMDGLEVLRVLRAERPTRAVRVVVVSADAMGGVPEAVAAAGADGYVAKPLEIRALLQEVDRQLATAGDAGPVT